MEQEILKTIEKFSEKLPEFPDGRIDYSKSDVAPIITVFVKHETDILLLKRSNKVLTYRGKWNVVAGYLDELKPIREKVLEELNEELGIGKDEIVSIRLGKPYEFTDPDINKTWIFHPIVVELKEKPEIKLDWEHTEFQWIKKEELTTFDIVPKLDKGLENGETSEVFASLS